MIVIEMNPRVSRSQRPGEQGDRVPDRQDRRQARRRLPARRDPQRHHPRDARLLRADDRLRRDQDPALGVREVSRGRPRAHHADEVGRRGDGDRPHLQGVAPESPARPGGRPVRPGLRQEGPLGHRRDSRPSDEIKAKLATPNAERVWSSATRCSAGLVGRADPRADGDRPLVPGQPRRARRARGPAPRGAEPGGGRRRLDPRGEAERLLRPAARDLWGTHRDRGPPRPPAPGDRGRLQAGRHLRRRVRGGHALLLFDLRGRGRGAGRRASRGW